MSELVTCPYCGRTMGRSDLLTRSAIPEITSGQMAVEDAKQTSGQLSTFLPAKSGSNPHQPNVCPQCLCTLPAALVELATLNLTLIGAPGSGKTLFLQRATDRLPQILSRHFGLMTTQMEIVKQHDLNDSAESERLPPPAITSDAVRVIENGQAVTSDGNQDVTYERVNTNRSDVTLVLPLFRVGPGTSTELSTDSARVVLLHTESGQSLAPGTDAPSRTRALVNSEAVLFLFDPTQDLRIARSLDRSAQSPAIRQELILAEFLTRMRRHAGLQAIDKLKQPLIVVITKCDRLNGLNWSKKLIEYPYQTVYGSLNVGLIGQVSRTTRELLLQANPEVVATAEANCERVTYLPVNAFTNGERELLNARDGIHSAPSIAFSAELPVVFALHQVDSKLIQQSQAVRAALLPPMVAPSTPAPSRSLSPPLPPARTAETFARPCMPPRGGGPILGGLLGYLTGCVGALSGTIFGAFTGSPITGGDLELPRPVTDQVQFTLTAPALLIAGQAFVIDLWVHLSNQFRDVMDRAKQNLGDQISVKTKEGVTVERGTALTVRLSLPHFEVADSDDVVLWTGEIGNATFPVRVPEAIQPGSWNGTIRIEANGIPIAKLHFSLVTGSQCRPVANLDTRERRYQSAFASYASPDRDHVLARIQGLQKAVPQLDIFLDVAALRSGENWSVRLEQEISRRDVLYLFWSQHAQNSEWVEREWRAALRLHGIQGIDPIPLVSPDQVPPPPELGSHLHFNDWTLAYMRGRLGN